MAPNPLAVLLRTRSGQQSLTVDEPFTDGYLGDVPQVPDSSTVRPRVNMAPIGRSGRAHMGGFIEFDERNPELQGVRGLRKFDQMYRQDAHVRRLILMVWSPIQAGTWHLAPYGGDDATDQDREIADTIWWALTEHMSPNLWEHLGTVGPVLLRSGFAPFEQIWKTASYKGKTLALPSRLDLRLPRTIWRWFQDEDGDLAAISQILPNASNVTIPASELVYYRLQSEGDNWMGTSLLRQCYRAWYFKWHLEEIEAIGMERKAMGVPVAYPPHGADETTRGELEALLANLHVNEAGYMIMPGPHQQYDKDNGWLIDVIRYDGSSGTEINDAINRHTDAMAAAFLGDFMQLGHHQVGARATAEVQEDPFLTAVNGLTAPVLSPLNRLIDRIRCLNWPSAQGSPTLKCTLTDSASLSEIGMYVQQLVSVGAMQADPELEDWLRERAEMPAADGAIREARMAAKMDALTNPPDQQQNQDDDDDEDEGAPPSKPSPGKPVKLDDEAIADPAWFERLLHKDRLGKALDEVRERVQKLAGAAVTSYANTAAADVQSGRPLPPADPAVAAAIASAYAELYALGHDTVTGELADQHRQLATGRTAASSASQARREQVVIRAELTARAIVTELQAKLPAMLTTPGGTARTLDRVRQMADATATNRLMVEANLNSMPLVNAGRFDAADANSADIVQAQQTACLDDRTCDECAAENGTIYPSVSEAEDSVPVALCAGGPSRCRCTLVFMLADDPRAFM